MDGMASFEERKQTGLETRRKETKKEKECVEQIENV